MSNTRLPPPPDGVPGPRGHHEHPQVGQQDGQEGHEVEAQEDGDGVLPARRPLRRHVQRQAHARTPVEPLDQVSKFQSFI